VVEAELAVVVRAVVDPGRRRPAGKPVAIIAAIAIRRPSPAAVWGAAALGEEERTETAVREFATAATEDDFLASHRIFAWLAISAAVLWFATARWSLIEAGR
jgi:hypothetical protein